MSEQVVSQGQVSCLKVAFAFLEKRVEVLERQIENLSQHILELAKCDNFNSDLILDLRKRVETLEKGGE